MPSVQGGGAAQDPAPDAAMLRFPDIGPTHIVFVHANDLWIVPREGGAAAPLASPPGAELFPKFSRDGGRIAFVGNYDGNRDLYVISAAGGVPHRVTHHPGGETLCDFAGDDRLLFATSGLSGLGRQSRLFLVPTEGGLPEALPVPYGAWGEISPDGTWLAYTPHTTDFRTWKRYRGGMATDIWLYNLRDGSSRRMTDWEGTDTSPMWLGSRVYYLSDQGPEHRLNIWSYDPATSQRTQVTKFEEFDIKWPSAGPGGAAGEIVFQLGSGLHVLDVASGVTREVKVTVPGARPKLRPRVEDAARNITERTISPSGKRVAASARGDIWSMPAEEGSPRNLTRTSGIFERSPSWSPDGRWIAYLSDESGEYEFHLMQSDGKAPSERLTSDGSVFRYGALWAPDSSKFLFADKTGSLWLYALGELESTDADADADADAEEAENGAGDGGEGEDGADSTADAANAAGAADALEEGAEEPVARTSAPPRHKPGTVTLIDRDPWGSGMQPSWSHDSRWIAYQRSDKGNPMTHLRLHDTSTGTSTQVTSGMFRDSSPTFDRKGDWLYFTSSRNFSSPRYEDLGTTFVYDNTGVLLAVPLRKDVKNPLLPRSDEEEWSKSQKSARKKGDKKEEKKEDGPGDEAGEKKNDDSAPADDGISGTWQLTLEGVPNMPGLVATASLRVDREGSVSGELQSIMGNVAITGGTWNRSARTLRFEFVTPDGGEGSITATVDGDRMEGNWAVPGSGGTFTGRRTEPGQAKAAAAEPKSDEGGDKKSDKNEKKKSLEIDLEGFEERAILIPISSGNFGDLAVNDGGALLFVRRGGRGGSGGEGPSIKLYDLADDKRSEKSVAAGGSFQMSADGKKLLVGSSILPASAGATGKPMVTQGMMVSVDPRAEWAQMVDDTWRIFRDWFYDPNMHHVDWKAVGDRYKAMLPDCASREDVAFVISEMISELNVGHAYYQGGGDVESSPSLPVGLLGCDFELDESATPAAFRIASIHEGGPWDADARGPLSAPGVEVAEGDYLLAVNGVPLDTKKDPWAAFIGLSGRPVALTVSAHPIIDGRARDIVVTPQGSEADLRYRAWIERNRAHVSERSGGRVGYIHVPDTGVNGQNNLFRQFYGQRHLDALIIDERWNGGGQIPTRFIELLNRPATNYWARRDGEDWRWPPDSHQGPKCMLVNGLAGSGGDAFPHYFRQAGLGKLIGTRTWGGLVGISGNPSLIDGASIAVPTFGFYELDGTWGIEGHGVDPDIEVIDDPALMRSGADPQLDRAIEQMLLELRERPFRIPARPASPNRAGMGIPVEDR
jgi:tricorn protease-like protein/C-terminal processing protease CtpA/Prc